MGHMYTFAIVQSNMASRKRKLSDQADLDVDLQILGLEEDTDMASEGNSDSDSDAEEESSDEASSDSENEGASSSSTTDDHIPSDEETRLKSISVNMRIVYCMAKHDMPPQEYKSLIELHQTLKGCRYAGIDRVPDATDIDMDQLLQFLSSRCGSLRRPSAALVSV